MNMLSENENRGELYLILKHIYNGDWQIQFLIYKMEWPVSWLSWEGKLRKRLYR